MDFLTIYKSNVDGVKSWITNTLKEYQGRKRRISALKCAPALSQYYSTSVLDNSYVIYCDEIPVLPLTGIAIPEFSRMNNKLVSGITYLDCFFAKASYADDIALHFHELVHVLQWKYLGVDKFLFCYAHGLLEKGYRHSPLEEMAYNLEDDFVAGKKTDVEAVVQQEMPYFEKLLSNAGYFKQ